MPLVYDSEEHQNWCSSDLWLATLSASGRKPATLSTYKYAIDQLKAWRNAPNGALETTTRIEAMAFTRHLLDNFTPMGVRSRIKSLTNFFNWCVAEDLCESNPFGKVKVSVPDEAMPIVSEDVLAHTLANAKKHSRRDYAIIVMLADSGARKGEIANVRMEDVDLRSGMLRFHESKTRARSVPMSDRLVVAVGHFIRQRGTKEGSLWGVSDPYSLVRAACRRHSGGTVNPHMFRRRFAVTWLLRGGSEVGLQRVAGWNSNTMVALYTKASSDVLATTEMRRLMS